MQLRKRTTLRTLGAMAFVAGMLAWFNTAPTATGNGYDATYTMDGEFDLGALFNVNHDSPNSHQLQLNTILSTFPLMWVANGGEDTASKVNTAFDGSFAVADPRRHGREVARYRSWYPNPGGAALHGVWTGPAPSRTAVDADGNAYVLNRHFGPSFDFQASTLPSSVMKVLASGYIDRNGNGVMDTSSDLNGDGVIQLATEVMPIGPDINGNNRPDSDSNGDSIPDAGEIKDERVAWIVQVGVVNGLGRAVCIGTDGNPWIGNFNERAYYKISAATGAVLSGPVNLNVNNNGRVAQPYGCAIDAAGRLFGANIADFISVIDTNTNTFLGNVVHGGQNYGITVGGGLAYMAQLIGGREWVTYNPVGGAIVSGPSGNSITVSLDGAGNRFVGSQNGSLRKYNSVGVLQWSAPAPCCGLDTRGTIIDAGGDVWRIHQNNSRIVKYNGATGAMLVDLPIGRFPYTYSDATGLTNLSETSASGTWTLTQDSGATGTIWDSITWNGSAPAGAALTGRVRASDNQGALASLAWTSATSGGSLSGITGQYIEVEMRLVANGDGDSPVLEDVRVLGHPPNSAPTADAGDDSTVPCSAVNCQGIVTLDGSGSSDPDPNDTLTYSWSGLFGTVTGETATVLVPLGESTITLTVTDSFGATSTDTLTVTAVDVTAPSISAPPSISVSQTSCSGTPASLGTATGSDACGPVTITSNAPATFPVGVTTVTFTATDGSGNVSTATSTVTVLDTAAPAIGSLTPSVTTLWPPNHQMVPVTFAWTMSDCDPGTTCSIVSVSSNEQVNGLGDGNTSPDWQITGGNTVLLRSERQGPANGRIYTITLQCVDAAGNATTRTTTVTVPHDQRGRGED